MSTSPRRRTSSSPSLGLTLCLASVALGVVPLLSGCGGGSNATTPATSQIGADGGSRALAQAITVSTSLMRDGSWAAAPAMVADTSTYVPSTFTGHAYHVDSVGGSDDAPNDGSLAKPWKTLSKVQGVSFQDGDAILLKCGSVWRESLSLNGLNKLNYRNVLVGAYPADNCPNSARPVIRASKWIDGAPAKWAASETGSAILVSRYDGAPILRLFRDGLPLMKARYPNPDPVTGHRFAPSTAVTLNTGETEDQRKVRMKTFFKIGSAELGYLQNKALAGATIYIRTLPFIVETAMVKAFDPATGMVELDHPLTYPIEQNAGYILEGKRWMLDAVGEWWFDTEAAQPAPNLYYQAPGGVTTGLEAGVLFTGLSADHVDNLRVERVRFEQQEESSISITSSSNVTIRDVESAHVHQNGILLATAPHAQIKDSRIEGAGLYGIYAQSADNAQLLGNYVTGTGLERVGALPNAADAGSAGIRLNGVNALAQGNYVHRSAYKGIWFNNFAGTVINQNTVVQPCLLLSDCGGIYTWGNLYSNEPVDVAGPIRSVVQDNMVIGAKSNQDGNFTFASGTVSGANQTYGIYLDDHSSRIEVKNNVVSNTEVGVYIHNGGFHQVHDNTVSGVTYASFLGSFDETGADLMRGNAITSNTFFSRRTVNADAFSNADIWGIDGAPVYAQLWTHTTDFNKFFADSAPGANNRNRSENNRTLTLAKVQTPAVWRLTAQYQMGQVSGAIWGLRSGNNNAMEKVGKAQWLAVTQAPEASRDTESSPVAYKPMTLTTATTLIGNGDFATTGSWAPNGGDFSHASGSVCVDAPNCGRFKATDPGHILASNAFSLSAQSLYVARYTVSAASEGGAHRSQIRLNADPWSSAGEAVPPMPLAPNESRRIEHFFKGLISSGNVVLSLRPSDATTATINKPIFFGKVTMEPVTGTPQALPPLSTLSVHVLNPSTGEQSFGCEQLGIASADCSLVVDDTNTPVGFPLVLQARNARQLYIRKAPWIE